jgi:hypothetical protein
MHRLENPISEHNETSPLGEDKEEGKYVGRTVDASDLDHFEV